MEGKIMADNCMQCEHFEPLYDGFGLCVMDEIPVTVLADYVPTKNYMRCKTKPSKMKEDGWCNDCDGDVKICESQNECEGYRRFNENTN